MTDAQGVHRFTSPVVAPTARDPWAHDPDRTTRHNVRRESIAPPSYADRARSAQGYLLGAPRR